MSGRLYREFYLLPRGEQRALILLSLLLILSLLFRITVHLLPEKEPEGLEEFEREARMILASVSGADSFPRIGPDTVMPKPEGYPPGTRSRQSPRNGGNPSLPIDINRADSVRLLPLPGIGPVLAGRIIKYRNLLGGFVSVDQLGEVYGMPTETVDLVRNRILIDSSAIRKIRIDSASFRALLRHPYLEYEDVKALVEYRDFKGDISSINELRMNRILPDSTLELMNGYIDFR